MSERNGNDIRPVRAPGGRKIYIETYGCQMNVSDSEVILRIMQDDGYTLTENIDEATLILANTCAIRDNAEQRIWGRIDQFRLCKRRRRGVVVGIVGCMAERLKDKLLESHVVDLVVGPDAYRRLPELVRAVTPDSPQIDTLLSRDETYADISPVRMDRNGVSGYISIMRGCNNVCSYCVVPFTRGVERSRDPQSIVREAKELEENGYREVTLLGQNVDSYLWRPTGSKDDCEKISSYNNGDDSGTVNFAGLLAMVARACPKTRIRFSTSHPKDISDEVLLTMAAYPNICHHIHLPVQSGSDVMLEKMRRKYTREWYLSRVARIREIMPDCGLTTDIIAGFCGETEEDHRATLSLMEEARFDAAFMFQYSERPGTLAARNYPDDIPTALKTSRLNEIIALQNRLSLESNERDVGKTFRVLIDGTSKRDAGQFCARASNNKVCVFTAPALHIGDYATVRVTSCTSATLLAELAE
ncbi:MAG: tRNA (N6-isopentenyl adenosine(37)-C2)-methylthiotransferase MiaB [Bacteroidales bacterium]|nr:tRNA (N6-isopentenyl adenosine(37)-C2)-methylthiotransferase MiaB [Bacteroidales bacterium]